VIEIDGFQHYEGVGEEKDKVRDTFLQSLGNTVLRYTNLQIKNNFKSVCEDILRYIKVYE
jgi:very-short-patch-repair endonuclease